MITLIDKLLITTTVIGLLAACAPPSAVPTSNNLTLEVRQLQSSLNRQEQAVLELSRQITGLEARIQSQAEEIDKLRQAPESSPTEYLPARASSLQRETTAPVQGEGSPTEIYLQAFGDYASGRYQKAVYGFEMFLQRFPNNSYASNAQFWLADCHFNQQQYPLAIQEFKRVLSDYQNAPKSPDALFKIAIAQLQLGASDEARQAVGTLVQRYPKSTAAQKAQELAIP